MSTKPDARGGAATEWGDWDMAIGLGEQLVRLQAVLLTLQACRYRGR